MNRTTLGALIVAGSFGALALGGTKVNAEEVKEGDNTYYVVESGDTLSHIAENYGTNFEVVHQNNLDLINDVNLIFGGQKLLVGGKDFDVNKSTEYQAPVEDTETYVEPTEEETYTEPVEETYTEPVAQTQVSGDYGSAEYAAQQVANATGTDASTWQYIIQAESGNDPYITNSIGCYGYFQIHPVHGISQGASVDEQIQYAIDVYNSQGFGAWEVMQ